MGRFYQELTSSKVTKAEALRRAQIYLMRDQRYQDTPFWAAYVLVGNWL
jgi:CHAT domain-containing protein